MEGIAMNLGAVLKVLQSFSDLSDEMIIVGGGSKSKLWRQIFADVFNMKIVKTNIGDEAGSLGAAAIAAVGCGLWKDFSKVEDIHQIEETLEPDSANHEIYTAIEPDFELLRQFQAKLGNSLLNLDF